MLNTRYKEYRIGIIPIIYTIIEAEQSLGI